MSVKTEHSPVVVTGMHRSGTSLVASILSALSIDMGQDLLPADSNNVRGHFEDVEFLRLQRTILSACCATNYGGHPDWGWTESESLDQSCFKRFLPEASALIASRSDRSTPWGWKDPNTTLLLDFWDELLGDARYILVYRYPWDVADSMQRLGAEVFLRNPEYGYRIWEYYNRHVRDFYSRHSDRCLLISSNALRGNQPEFRRLISSKLGIQVSGAELKDIHEDDLLKAAEGSDPLIDLVRAVWPGCTELLSELDGLADISAAGLWHARPVRSRLARPDSTPEEGSIDVSVVTPCYNQGVLLVEAVASVERFAPPGCELIIVNDGSQQPRTLEILEVLKRCGYFIVDQQNQGLSAARNAGIAMARGRYVLPLDDDNRIRADFIQDAIRVLDSSPDVGVVYGDRYDFGLRTRHQPIAEFDLARILEDNYIDACAVFRKQVWKDCGGYDLRMPQLEDWEFWIHAAERGWGFHPLHYITFDYRMRPGSLLSRVSSIEVLEELRTRILLKHPGAHVWLLSSKLTAEKEQVDLLTSKLAAEKEQVHLLTSKLAAEQEQVHLLTSKLAAEQEQVHLLSSKLAAEQEHVRVLSATVEQIEDQVLETERTIQSLISDAAASREERTALLEQLAGRDAELARIKGSRGWRWLQSYGRIKFRYLLPFYRLLGLMPKLGQPGKGSEPGVEAGWRGQDKG